jgi:hypothetical protein
MSDNRYPDENPEIDECGLIVESVDNLRTAVIGHRIVKAEKRPLDRGGWGHTGDAFVITLDNGKQVRLFDSGDCCAYTELAEFLLHPELVDHVILGVGTTEKFTRWHIFADMGDVLELTVGWSEGNPCYYGYGFDIDVVEIDT